MPLVKNILVNGPHAIISIAAFLIALKVGKWNDPQADHAALAA